MEIGIMSLADLQSDPEVNPAAHVGVRMREIISYGVIADEAGLDIFGLGEHHSSDFAVANPVVPLAAIAQATKNIRLTSAVSVLPTVDPVRLHQDFASLDLISKGRAEIIAGRSAFLEAFALFGIDPAEYDAVFAEKLDLLMQIRANQRVTWSGRYRSELRDLEVPPRPQQHKIPLWLGVGGTPASAERAARLGLPMVLGLIGGDIRRVRLLVQHYRAVGEAAGHAQDSLRAGVTNHLYVGKTSQGARNDLFPYYRAYFGGLGRNVGADDFQAASSPFGALITGSPQEVVDKILTERELLRVDRFMGQIDLGGMPADMVTSSIELLATEVAPVIRRETGAARS